MRAIIYCSQLELGAVQVKMAGYSLVVHVALADIPNEKVHVEQGNDEPHIFTPRACARG